MGQFFDKLIQDYVKQRERSADEVLKDIGYVNHLSILEKVKNIIAETPGLENYEITPDYCLGDSGAARLDIVELISSLEEFDIDISYKDSCNVFNLDSGSGELSSYKRSYSWDGLDLLQKDFRYGGKREIHERKSYWEKGKGRV